MTGRKEDEAVRVSEECAAAQLLEGWPARALGLRADFTDAKEMVALREMIERGMGLTLFD